MQENITEIRNSCNIHEVSIISLTLWRDVVIVETKCIDFLDQN